MTQYGGGGGKTTIFHKNPLQFLLKFIRFSPFVTLELYNYAHTPSSLFLFHTRAYLYFVTLSSPYSSQPPTINIWRHQLMRKAAHHARMCSGVLHTNKTPTQSCCDPSVPHHGDSLTPPTFHSFD